MEKSTSKMFLDDNPIKSKDEDLLGRVEFGEKLANALSNWKGPESLVVALYGPWGVGKSSIINLATETLISKGSEKTPTIIEFNPWSFSGLGNIEESFFSEIAKELRIRNEEKKDRKTAKKLLYYSKMFSVIPGPSDFAKVLNPIFVFLGIIGLLRGASSWQENPVWSSVAAVFGIIFLIASFSQTIMQKIAQFLEFKADLNIRTRAARKKELHKELLTRNKRLLIVIDDIDRLSEEEVTQVFKLIRVNADFPNTIYLLAFDRKIVSKHLGVHGLPGKDYLEKIVQVNFDVPLVRPEKISDFLFQELNRVLDTLPQRAMDLFDKDYWGNVYHSGFKHFFENIRNVKRFMNSLSFNVSLMHKGDSIEVNPVDFIAIEGIRVFCPDFYQFMKTNNRVFTATDDGATGESYKDVRKKAVEEAVTKIPGDSVKYLSYISVAQTRSCLFQLLCQLLLYVEYPFCSTPSTWGNSMRKRFSTFSLMSTGILVTASSTAFFRTSL